MVLGGFRQGWVDPLGAEPSVAADQVAPAKHRQERWVPVKMRRLHLHTLRSFLGCGSLLGLGHVCSQSQRAGKRRQNQTDFPHPYPPCENPNKQKQEIFLA